MELAKDCYWIGWTLIGKGFTSKTGLPATHISPSIEVLPLTSCHSGAASHPPGGIPPEVMEMKVLLIVGLLVLVLGIVSLFVAFPHTENHAINAGPLSANVQTKDHEKLPPA